MNTLLAYLRNGFRLRFLFWLLTLLPLLLLLGWEHRGNDRLFYAHFANPAPMMALAGVLLVLLLGGACLARRQRIAVLPSPGKRWTLFALASLYSLSGNAALLHSDALLLISAFSALGTMCLLWALIKQLSLLFWVPFMLLQMLQIAAFLRYGALINNELVFAEILEASREEIFSYATPINICAIFLLLLLAAGLGWLLARSMRQLHRLSLLNLGILSLLLAGGALTLSSDQRRHADNMWPLIEMRTLVNRLQAARTYNTEMLAYIKSLPSPAHKPSSLSTVAGDEGVVLVLHIGESVRADRLTLNGYRNHGRSTTPWLDSQNGHALINFSHCISCAPSTARAHAGILTDARRAFVSPSERADNPGAAPHANATNTEAFSRAQAGSVIDLFAANRFSVYAFTGRVMGQELQYDKVIRELTRPTQERYFAVTLPQDVLPHMGNVLRKHPGENLLFFIHNEGSHVPFCYYEEATAPFHPSRPDFSNPAAHAEEVSNAYDNTIHYTDEYIRRVVEHLQGRPFLYLYVSDHGEYLGHDGLWGRGGIGRRYHETTACHVGMFIITSPELEALHPHIAESVQRLRTHADMCIGHEHIYHTLLGIFGLSTPYYDARLDLSSESPEPYTGPQPATPLP